MAPVSHLLPLPAQCVPATRPRQRASQQPRQVTAALPRARAAQLDARLRLLQEVSDRHVAQSPAAAAESIRGDHCAMHAISAVRPRSAIIAIIASIVACIAGITGITIITVIGCVSHTNCTVASSRHPGPRPLLAAQQACRGSPREARARQTCAICSAPCTAR